MPNSETCASGRVAYFSNSCAEAFNATPLKINVHVNQLIGAPPAPGLHLGRFHAWVPHAFLDPRTSPFPSPRRPRIRRSNAPQIPPRLEARRTGRSPIPTQVRL